VSIVTNNYKERYPWLYLSLSCAISSSVAFCLFKCKKCIIDLRGELSIELLDQSTGRNLVAGGIPRSKVDSCRGIANFIADMKAQLAMQGGVEAVSRRG